MSKMIISIPRDPSQGVTVKVEGFIGQGCKALTEAVESALGQTVKDTTTDEFNVVAPQEHQQQQKA